MNRVIRLIAYAVLLLTGVITASAQELVRGPYLQMGSTSSVTVRWRTNAPTDSVVRYGKSLEDLNFTASDSIVETEHRIRLSGLDPDSTYYYSIGSSTTTFASGEGYFFLTAPIGVKPTRIWVLGDSGTANVNQIAVRDAYYNFTGARHTDLWLMLGDNAYPVGTDEDYQRAVFDIFPDMLRKTVLWSTLGNHDGFSADSASQTGPYYDIFTLPQQGEAGGVASGTEAYYSFDYGNIHFVCLDSNETNRSSTGTMAEWLRDDLANQTKDWLIAFFHHPPYTRGSHDSDFETELVEMRQEILPILEEYGVDLVLSGHSHSYERSQFIDGHYGVSSTFSSSMVVQTGSGREDETGAYTKNGEVAASHAGTIYAVAGASGQTSGGALNHPAMYISLNVLGSLVIDVDGDRLDAQYIDDTGARRDYFTLLKTEPDNHLPTVELISPPNGLRFLASVDLPVRATASDDDGTVAKVSFYAGSSLIGEDTTSPYEVVWRNAPAGEHQLTAVAVDDRGGARTSNPISITITDPPGAPTTVTLQDGVNAYSGTSDTKLTRTQAAAVFGRAAILEADGRPGHAALVRWDLKSIPPGKRVLSVKLTFNVTDRSSQTYEIYALRRPWIENGASWLNARNGIRWQLAGANGAKDRVGVVLGRIYATTVGLRTVPLNLYGIAQVQAWINHPETNFGFIIQDYRNVDGLDFSSREAAVVSKRPQITITYQ